jgi:hypothetical protein
MVKMPTAAPSPAYYAGMPLSWNVQANGNEALTGNADLNTLSAQLTQSGLLAETYDPRFVSAGSDALTANGTVAGVGLTLPVESTVTNIVCYLVTAGGTLTANKSWALLFNSAGTLVGQTADQSTAWAGTPGLIVAPLATPAANLPAGRYYVGFVSTETVGALPAFAAAQVPLTLFNQGTTLAAGNYNAALLATGVTTAPASLSTMTASPVTLTGAVRIWAGLS